MGNSSMASGDRTCSDPGLLLLLSKDPNKVMLCLLWQHEKELVFQEFTPFPLVVFIKVWLGKKPQTSLARILPFSLIGLQRIGGNIRLFGLVALPEELVSLCEGTLIWRENNLLQPPFYNQIFFFKCVQSGKHEPAKCKFLKLDAYSFFHLTLIITMAGTLKRNLIIYS